MGSMISNLIKTKIRTLCKHSDTVYVQQCSAKKKVKTVGIQAFPDGDDVNPNARVSTRYLSNCFLITA